MVSTVAASCGRSRSAIWGTSAQQQNLRWRIEQTIQEHCQLSATEQAPPLQAPPTVEPAKPISSIGKQQALLSHIAVSEAPNRCTAQVHGCRSGKASISNQKPAWPVAQALGNPIITEAKAAPCTTGKLFKLEPKAGHKDASAQIQGADATAQSQDGLAAEQPVSEVQQPSKRLRLMSAVPPKAAATACKQEETQAVRNGEEADNTTKESTGVHCSQSIPALCGLIQQVPPQKPRSRRPPSASSILLRSQGGKDAKSSFHSAAATAEAIANTTQPKALRRCQCHCTACKEPPASSVCSICLPSPVYGLCRVEALLACPPSSMYCVVIHKTPRTTLLQAQHAADFCLSAFAA